MMRKRWYRLRNYLLLTITVTSCLLCVYKWYNGDCFSTEIRLNINIARRDIIKTLQEALIYDRGTGCKIPVLDVYSEDVTQFERNATPITCKGQDWVKCYHSECRVVKEILDTTRGIVCTYRDIIYVNDNKYVLGAPVDVYGNGTYILVTSDHVKIKCIGTHLTRIIRTIWIGKGAGFRTNVSRTIPPLPTRRNSLNVLIFGYESLSKNGFIRRMPKTYEYITEELKLTILQQYNIVGDGTPAAIFPILSGITELEIPDARKIPKNNVTIDSKKFIFHKVKQHGYRTAYFEDVPSEGTFQNRFNGFDVQPADHYLRGFFLEDWNKNNVHCVGATPTYRWMMNLTEQFLSFSNLKLFIFNFMVSVGYEDPNVIAQVDVTTMEFLKSFKEKGYTKDTLLIFMGDHGARYYGIRKTVQGRLEERLPLMAILLPEVLRETRPSAQEALELNSRVLTTPFDIHATLLDALDLTQYTVDYTIPGADFPRGMSLLKPIPQNRSCSEAGIEPHWCTCTSWKYVRPWNYMYEKTAQALLDYINRLTEPVRFGYSMKKSPLVWQDNSNQWINLSFTVQFLYSIRYTAAGCGAATRREANDVDGYTGVFGSPLKLPKEYYYVKLTVGPGAGVIEGNLTYIANKREYSFDSISITNLYHQENDCIKRTHPYLNKYCYCEKTR